MNEQERRAADFVLRRSYGRTGRMDRRIHLPDYSFPEKEQGSLQFVASSPCFLLYQQIPEEEGAGFLEREGERFRGWERLGGRDLTETERTGTLARLET